MPSHILAVDVEFQIKLSRQARNEFLIRVRLRPAQLVIEMNYGEDNPQLAPQLQQQPQQRNRINAAGNGDANTVPSRQQFLPPNVGKHALRQWMHENMVPHDSCGDSRLGCPRSEASQGVYRSHAQSELALAGRPKAAVPT